MHILTRRPLVTAPVVAVLALIVADASRQAIDRGTRHPHTWPVYALAGFVAYDLAAFGYLTSPRGRSKVKLRDGTQADVGIVLLALTIVPVLVAVATLFAEAPTWTMWASLGVTCVLLMSWIAVGKPAGLR